MYVFSIVEKKKECGIKIVFKDGRIFLKFKKKTKLTHLRRYMNPKKDKPKEIYART